MKYIGGPMDGGSVAPHMLKAKQIKVTIHVVPEGDIRLYQYDSNGNNFIYTKEIGGQDNE